MQTVHDGKTQPALDRRRFLKVTAAAAIAVTGSAIIHSGEAWGMETKALTPAAMRTLVVMARDVFPHDRLADKYYALAVKSYDDPATKAATEAGIAMLDGLANAAHGVGYAEVAWESERVALLRQIEGSAFFSGLRGGMVVSLYNNPDLWPLFGYEGESAAKGGYIHRGFNDLEWL